MFLHVSVILFTRGVPGQVPPGRYTLQAGTPPRRYTPQQVHAQGRYPQAGAPLGRYTPLAGTPPGQVHPQAGNPRHVHPPGQVHPPAMHAWIRPTSIPIGMHSSSLLFLHQCTFIMHRPCYTLKVNSNASA